MGPLGNGASAGGAQAARAKPKRAAGHECPLPVLEEFMMPRIKPHGTRRKNRTHRKSDPINRRGGSGPKSYAWPGFPRRRGDAPVHPRACGGNGESRFVYLPQVGASPRLRGKLPTLMSNELNSGCIPAPAGETGLPVGPVEACRVHPRACGGNPGGRDFRRRAGGASPRLRGKLRRPVRAALRPGCIPAPAGETSSSTRTRRVSVVHPRACGGNRRGTGGRANPGGASPRLRGKLRPSCSPADGRRCIPAPAGETHTVGGWWGPP